MFRERPPLLSRRVEREGPDPRLDAILETRNRPGPAAGSVSVWKTNRPQH